VSASAAMRRAGRLGRLGVVRWRRYT
jgi:hypothetical protein